MQLATRIRYTLVDSGAAAAGSQQLVQGGGGADTVCTSRFAAGE